MSTFDVVAINLIFLVSSAVCILLLGDAKSAGPEERKVRKVLLGGLVLFHGARWLPFVVALVGRTVSR